MAIDEQTVAYLSFLRDSVKEFKPLTRKELLEIEKLRNSKLRSLLKAESQSEVPTLFEIRVSIESILVKELGIKKEKRGRVFVGVESDGVKSIRGLTDEVKSYFRVLGSSAIKYRVDLPKVLEDGSIYAPEEKIADNVDPFQQFWTLNNDTDVEKSFLRALDFFKSHNEQVAENVALKLKRPCLLIHVEKDLESELPQPLYLHNMPSPKDTTHMTMLSFYSFPPSGIEDPDNFMIFVKKAWEPFDCLGRVYIAHEGINAQMAVPTNVIENFRKCCHSIPEMGIHIENGINIDPIPLTIEEFAVAGNIDGTECPPFKNLMLKVRQKVVADGLDHTLDWESAGYDMPPLEWHQKLKEAKQAKQSGDDEKIQKAPLIFDCRNTYETNVGIFEGAEPLATENFRDSWDAFKDKLKDKPKDTPIMTYCTGGIRCVKVGAYLTQEMGFTNVARLAGGIIAYDRTLNDQAPEEEPMFKGTNYVFDGRVGRQITEDALGQCITCDRKTNLLSNCMNVDCHKRMVQCAICSESFRGCCSKICQESP